MRLVVALVVAISSIAVGTQCDEDTGCKDDFDCEQAFVCKASSGACEPFVCKSDADCTNGLSCDDNECQ